MHGMENHERAIPVFAAYRHATISEHELLGFLSDFRDTDDRIEGVQKRSM